MPADVGSWVRMKTGLYKGDLAKVTLVDHSAQRATIKLVPRIDYAGVCLTCSHVLLSSYCWDVSDAEQLTSFQGSYAARLWTMTVVLKCQFRTVFCT